MPSRSDRPVGSADRTSGRGRRAGRTAARAVDLRRAATRPTSARGALPLQRERAEEADLVLELDTELREDAPPRLDHQRQRVGRRRTVRVLDEVGVARRDDRAADAVALQAALFDQAPRPTLAAGILEDGSERALVRRLRRLAPGEQLGDRRLDLVGLARL